MGRRTAWKRFAFGWRLGYRLGSPLVITMFRSRRHSEEHRYYCLPGMGRSNRRHRHQIHMWAVAFGVVVSAVVGTLIYLFNR